MISRKSLLENIERRGLNRLKDENDDEVWNSVGMFIAVESRIFREWSERLRLGCERRSRETPANFRMIN